VDFHSSIQRLAQQNCNSATSDQSVKFLRYFNETKFDPDRTRTFHAKLDRVTNKQAREDYGGELSVTEEVSKQTLQEQYDTQWRRRSKELYKRMTRGRRASLARVPVRYGNR
jgi:hypothetical protein